jgi:hypothetical protein
VLGSAFGNCWADREANAEDKHLGLLAAYNCSLRSSLIHDVSGSLNAVRWENWSELITQWDSHRLKIGWRDYAHFARWLLVRAGTGLSDNSKTVPRRQTGKWQIPDRAHSLHDGKRGDG